MRAAVYLSRGDSLIITPAELGPPKILQSSTVIYRTEMCLEGIQHYGSVSKSLTSQMKTEKRLNTGDIGPLQDFMVTAA